MTRRPVLFDLGDEDDGAPGKPGASEEPGPDPSGDGEEPADRADGRSEAREAEAREAEAQRAAAQEQAERERAAQDEADRQRQAREQAEREQAARDRAAREAAERERLAEERAAREAAERAERERAERENAERERAERERLARERAAQGAAERNRAERERAARERAERERLGKERAAREAAERVARETAERERAERERLAKERAAREAAERERAARETAEREKAERERLAKERAAREAAERAARETAERERAERERAERERAERERLAKERAAREAAERERAARERAERERLAKERAERERLSSEAAERERAERDRQARAQAAREASETAERERVGRQTDETGPQGPDGPADRAQDRARQQPGAPRPRAKAPRLFETEETAASAPPETPATAPPVPDLEDGELPPRGRAMQAVAALAARKPSRLAKFFWGSLSALLGFAISVAFWDFVTSLLNRNSLIGIVALTLVGLFLLAVLLVVLKELAAFGRLRRLDLLHKEADEAIASHDLARARSVLDHLLGFYGHREEIRWGRQNLEERRDEVFDADGLLSMTERELLAPLDAAALREIEGAARTVATVTAIVPLALADVIAALTANLRMIRRIAEIYGGRSGLFGSIRLARAVMTHLVATGAVAVGDDMIGSIAGGGMLARVSRRFGEGVINGALTARVGVAAMEVCRPLPFREMKRPAIGALVKRALAGLFNKAEPS